MHLAGIKLSNIFLSAPLAGVSSPPYRLMARQGGAGLVYSEMISAAGLARRQPGTIRLTMILPEERPVALQLFGADPQTMYQAACLIRQTGADLLDINMGCPVRKVRRQGAGSALPDDPVRAVEVIKAAQEGWAGPVTIKMRLGHNSNTLEKTVPPLLDAGVAAICLHGRTVQQGYGGQADWTAITNFKAWCPVPVIGNGDVHSPQEAVQAYESSGCDAIMIGRGGLADPWIFARSQDLLQGRSPRSISKNQRGQALLTQAELTRKLFGEKAAVHFLKVFVMWFSRSQAGASNFRRAVGQSTSLEQILQYSRNYFLEHQA